MHKRIRYARPARISKDPQVEWLATPRRGLQILDYKRPFGGVEDLGLPAKPYSEREQQLIKVFAKQTKPLIRVSYFLGIGLGVVGTLGVQWVWRMMRRK